MNIEELTKKFGIALTGGVATGKSTIAAMIKSMGYEVFDADQLTREAVEPKSLALAKIVDVFGGRVLRQDGSLDRALLRNIVFDDPERRKQLEQILHPIIEQLLAKHLREKKLDQSAKPWFYEASLIFETGRQNRFRQVWVTYCGRENQIKRLMKRDGVDRSLAEKMMAAQMPSKKKIELAHFAIDTRASVVTIESKIKNALSVLTESMELE